MVYSVDEKNTLLNSHDFQMFTARYPKADILVRKNNNLIPEDVAEWYARIHTLSIPTKADNTLIFSNTKLQMPFKPNRMSGIFNTENKKSKS